jgi:excisionase family DNA binding protein
MGENHGSAHNADSVSDSFTISEAAALLGVHKNTVRNRIKDGIYEAEQVVTERGPTYFIEAGIHPYHFDYQHPTKRFTGTRCTTC